MKHFAEDYKKNFASDMTSVARAVSGGAEADKEEVQQYQVRSRHNKLSMSHQFFLKNKSFLKNPMIVLIVC